MTAGLLFVTVLLIFVNGFFVAVEFALLASRAARLERMAESGADTGASAALDAVQDLQPQLVGAQLGITMASLGLGYVGEPAVAVLFEAAIGVFVVLPSGVLHTLSFIVALSIVAFAHMVVGEMVAKNLAISNPERVARVLAPFHAGYLLVFKPVIWSLNLVANGIVRLFGTEPVDEINTALTVNEFHTFFDGVRQDGKIEDTEHDLLAGALAFRDRTAESIMVPAQQMVSMPRTSSVQELEDIVATSGHSRIPIWGSGPTNILGFVHSKDLLRLADANGNGATHGDQVPLEIVRRMLIVQRDQSVRDLMFVMRRRRCHAALVQTSDTASSPLGMVTLEDVLEALVGDIRDETDQET
ncbi:MAG: hemolysin family protein [Acidimicrobiia bacterium]|nr:hemolysin family protein [Acidimicrobiia bacterium]MCY4458024.1 hemolysin family protein [Acidimicrobiaceae bacterium]